MGGVHNAAVDVLCVLNSRFAWVRRCELLSPQALLRTCFCRLLTCLALQMYVFGSGYFWAPDGESCLVINGPAVLAAVMQNSGKFVDGLQVVPESVLKPLVGFLRNKMPGNCTCSQTAPALRKPHASASTDRVITLLSIGADQVQVAT